MPFRRAILGIAFLSALTSLTGYFLGILAVCTDCLSRTYWATEWWLHPRLHQIVYWLPLHSILYGGVFRLIGRPLLAAHLLNSACAGLTVYLGSLLAYRWSGSKWAGMFSALLIATSPVYVWFGFSMLSEPFMNVLVLSFALTVLSWLRGAGRSWLLVSVLILLLMTMDRYFAWPVAAVFGLMVLDRERSGIGIAMALVCWAFPLLWLFVTYLSTGNVLFGFVSRVTDSHDFYRNGQPNWAVLGEYVRTLGLPLITVPLAFIPGWPGGKGLRRLAWVALLVFVVELAMIWNQVPTVFPIRSFAVSGLAFLLLTGSWIAVCWESPSAKFRRLALGFLVSLLGYHLFFVGRIPSNLDREALQAGKTLASSGLWNRAVDRGLVGFELPPMPALHVVVASGRSDRFVPVVFDLGRSMVIAQNDVKIRPRMFLVESKEKGAAISKVWPASSSVKLGRFYFVTADKDLIRDLAR